MPDKRRYTIAICKGAALLDETRSLLEHWQPGEPPKVFSKRVQLEGLLGKATAYRVSDIVHRVFIPRYLRPDDRPARILKTILQSRLRPAVFNELVFLYASRNDFLLRDYAIREFWSAVRRGRLTLDVASVLSFFSEAAMDGRIEKPWSEQVSKKVARGLLGFLREIGFNREPVRGRKELVDYRLSDEGLLLISRILHEDGAINSTMVNHQDWGLFGLERTAVLARLHLLSEDSGLLVQQAGSVVSVNWKVDSIGELLIKLRSQNVVSA